MEAFEVNNGLVGMGKYICLRLMKIDAVHKVRESVISGIMNHFDEYEDHCEDEYEDELEDDDELVTVDYLQTEPFEQLIERRQVPLYNCRDNIKTILGTCNEIFNYRLHFFFSKMLEDCQHFDIHKREEESEEESEEYIEYGDELI